MKTEEVINLVRGWDCPACGPNMLVNANRFSVKPEWQASTICLCCLRVYTINLQDSDFPISIESYNGTAKIKDVDDPPCPHKWPIEYNNPDAEPLTAEEEQQVDGQEITRSPYQLELSLALLAQMLAPGHDWHYRIIAGPDPSANIVGISLKEDALGNLPIAILEYDKPVPEVSMFETIAPPIESSESVD